MKKLIAAASLAIFGICEASAQMQFSNLEQYCSTVSEASSATLLARLNGVSNMSGMTGRLSDPNDA